MWIYIAGLILVGALAISNQSLWIDDGYTAFKARQATLPEWWRLTMLFKGSDLQMPLFTFWIWICGRIVGTSELALRWVNLLWLAPGLLALLRVFKGQPRVQLAVFLTTALSPFVWYYLKEVRPYAMQLGASLFLAAALCHWDQKEPDSTSESGWVWGFIVALIVISGASLLGMIWAAFPVAAAFLLLPKDRLLDLGRRYVFAWLVGLFLLGALGIYFLWALKSGGRASTIAGSDWKNILFILYELLGFSGLGPGRLAIRSSQTFGVFASYLPPLTLYAVAVFVLLFFATGRLWHTGSRKRLIVLLLLAAAPACFILSAGAILKFRVLGRHFAPLYPCVVLVLALGATTAWQRGFWGKVTVVTFFSLSLISCLTLRFSVRHANDDYRSAAAVASAALARGEKVWWNASEGPALYYHVPLTSDPEDTKRVYCLINPTRKATPQTGLPDVIITSRPDTFDVYGAMQDLIRQDHFTTTDVFPAFVIWEKNPLPNQTNSIPAAAKTVN